MNRLKICIVALRALPLFHGDYDSEHVIGGAEVNMYQLARCFSGMKNIEVKVLVDDLGQPKAYKKEGIELIRLGRSGRRGLAGRLARKILETAQLFSIRSDVFIFTTSNSLLGKLVLLQRVLKNKTVIFRLSSDLNTDLQQFEKMNGLYARLLYQFGLAHASHIVAQTENQKKLLETRLGLKSTVIENGFIINGCPDIRQKKLILWVGRCMDSKKPMTFVELARCLPEEEFVMIMPVNREIPAGERLEREKLAEAVRRGVEQLDNNTLIDYVPYNAIQDYFNRAKVYVCTSELEGFPNTFIQAALAAAPILSYHIDPDHVIEEYHLGCFCRSNNKKAISFIREMNNEVLSEYKYHMGNYVMQKHNITLSAGKYLELAFKGYASGAAAEEVHSDVP